MGCGEMECVEVASNKDQQRARVNTVMNIFVQWKVGSLLTGWGTIRFSRRILLRGDSLRCVCVGESSSREVWSYVARGALVQ
jgi:hypothetical protein